MSSSARGDRATAQHPRLVSALTSARDETRAKFENAISTGKRALLGRLRLPRANPTCVASISSSVGAPGSTNKVAEVAAAGKDKGTTGSDNTEQYKARRVTGTGRKNGDVETRDLAKQLVRAPPASNEVALVSTDESSSGGGVGDVSGGSDGKAGAKTGDGKGGAKTSDGKGGTKGSDNKGTSTTTTPMTADSVTTGNKDGSTASEDDTRPILISSVDFEGETPELEQLARSVVRIKPNFSYTVKEIERDVVRVFNTGLFKEVTPVTVDTRDGISLSFKLVANPTIRGFVVKGCDELPNSFAHDLFKPQFGRTLNSNLVVDACSAISRWYEKRKIPVEWYSVEVSDGILELNLEEPRIGEVEIRFIDRKTGEPIKGATRKEMITRHLKNVKPGKALHGRMLDDLNDLINTAGLENANITWKYVCAGFPKSDTHGFISNAPVTVDQAIATYSSCEGPRRDRKQSGPFLVDAVVNVTEKASAGFSGGGGISAKGLQEGGLSALLANADYFRRNLFGRCQTLTARVEISPNNLSSKPEIDVRIAHSDPWIGDSSRTSRRIFLDSDSSTLEQIYAKRDDARDDDDHDAHGNGSSDVSTGVNGSGDGTVAGDGPRGVFVKRITSGVEYRRPLAPSWTGTFSATYQRAMLHDDLKQPIFLDAYGSPLTFSGEKHDTSVNMMMRFVYEGRGRDEAQLVVSAEQAVPVRPEMLVRVSQSPRSASAIIALYGVQSDRLKAFNRLMVRAQRDFRFGRGARLTVAAKGGNVIGDLPPYEAFSIGGTSSVRGYTEGGVGTGRKFIVGSLEVAVPLARDSVNGCVFFDIGSDLKSGVSVLGDPGGTRGKPGQGYGYGAGVVALTPIGPVRLEYAFSDKGVGRVHCGLSRNF